MLRRTWSGVPRQVLESLVSEGYDVKLLNLFGDFFFHWAGAAWNRLHDFRRREFESTRLGGFLMARAVRRAARGCDKVVALTFALDAAKIPVPVELIHDWTLGYFWNRQDDAETRQIELMRHASKIKCLYPASTEYLRSKGLEVEYIGVPVCIPDYVRDRVRDKVGRDGPRFVVFASPWHRDNLDEALKYLEGRDDYCLDVIGADGEDTQRVSYHGYLDKDNPCEAREYWDIMVRADCLLALGRSWPGGSSIVEAKACGCMVVTRDWPDLQGILP